MMTRLTVRAIPTIELLFPLLVPDSLSAELLLLRQHSQALQQWNGRSVEDLQNNMGPLINRRGFGVDCKYCNCDKEP